ncbi:hypothetical protein, partial [Parasutterella excrementihominis]|uniref:hypothetical protein n=1 Tax=Parasutterella excrementihominis TaxID=487175 RepID=UPI003A92D3D6
TCKNQAVLLWAIPLKQKPAEATSTLSYGCRRSGRNPLHLRREGSQLGESEKLPVLPNRLFCQTEQIEMQDDKNVVLTTVFANCHSAVLPCGLFHLFILLFSFSM